MLTLPTLWDDAWECESMRGLMTDLAGKMRLGHPLMVSRLLRGIFASLELEVPQIHDAHGLEEMVHSVNPDRLANHPITLTETKIRIIYRRSLLPVGGAERQACLDIWKYYNCGQS